jgi:hypothetical protein
VHTAAFNSGDVALYIGLTMRKLKEEGFCWLTTRGTTPKGGVEYVETYHICAWSQLPNIPKKQVK